MCIQDLRQPDNCIRHVAEKGTDIPDRGKRKLRSQQLSLCCSLKNNEERLSIFYLQFLSALLLFLNGKVTKHYLLKYSDGNTISEKLMCHSGAPTQLTCLTRG